MSHSAAMPLPSGASDDARRAVRRRVMGIAWAVLALTIFSGWFVVTRFSVTRNLQVWDIVALRFGVGAVVLAPVLMRRGVRLSRAAWGEGLLLSLLWGLPFVLLVAGGLRLTSAMEAASITPAIMPVLAGVLGWIFLRERQGWARWIGHAAIVVGLVCLVGAGIARDGPPSSLGLAALVGAGLMWAIYTLRLRGSALSAVQAAALICTWSALLFLPVYLLSGASRLSLASPSELVVQILYQGVAMSCLAVVSFNRAVALLGPSAAAAIIALLPAVASLVAIPVLGEIPAPAQWAAIAAIGIGVLLAARRPSLS